MKEIFGRSTNAIGRPLFKAYRKQINALDIKLNEYIETNGTDDKAFILGLFDLACSRFGMGLKTNIDRYKDDFYAFLEQE